MTWDKVGAIASVGQLIVIVVAVVLAYLQLLGLRRQQEAQIVQGIFDELNAPEFSTALDFVYNHLPEKLTDPVYVRGIRDGTATASSHKELIVMHFFNKLGLLVHEKLVSDLIVPFVATPCMRSWAHLAPVVELMRRHYPHAYTPFEALVARARAVDLSAINARFRAETPYLRSEWERSARDLVEGRIRLLDEPSEKLESQT